MAVYTGFSVWGGGFGNLIAYGVFQITDLHIKNWQLLFILYGSISCLFGVLVAVVVPYKLGTAWSTHANTDKTTSADIAFQSFPQTRNVML